MSGEGDVAPEEHLWRGVLSRRDARRAERGQIDHRLFLAPRGVLEISVSRLDGASEGERARIGEALAAARGPDRSFYGWVVAKAADVRGEGMAAAPAPLPGNPAHANILLPPEAGDPAVREDFAHRLAAIARWVPRA